MSKEEYINIDYCKNVNIFTGEVLPFKAFSNVKPDKGVKNTGEDLCRKEDFEPICSVIARFLRSGGADKVISDEYAYNSDNIKDISEDDAFDHVNPDDDVLDQQMDLEDYMDSRIASCASDSAFGQEVNVSDERAQQSEEQTEASQAEKPSE